MNLCFVFDRGYIGQFKVTVYSVAVNNRDVQISVHILCHALNEADKEEIVQFLQKLEITCTFHEIDETPFCGLPKLRDSYAAYYKLLIPKYLFSLGRVLYLDCDMIVRKSLSPLYSMETAAPLVAVEDAPVKRDHPDFVDHIVGENKRYFNSGVMLFDFHNGPHAALADMVEYGKAEASVLKYHDQDILNHFYGDRVCFIDDTWNYLTGVDSLWQIFTDRRRQVVLHYAGSKPWKSTYKHKFYYLYLKYYKRCAKLTPLSFLQKRKPMFLLFLDFIKKRVRSGNK